MCQLNDMLLFLQDHSQDYLLSQQTLTEHLEYKHTKEVFNCSILSVVQSLAMLHKYLWN